MNWNNFAREIHQNAVEKGWWEKLPSFDDVICMCICELAEAVEEWRNGRPNLYYPCNAGGVCERDNPNGMDCGSRGLDPDHREIYCTAQSDKPCGEAVELADCVLRLLDYLATSEEGPILPIEPIVPSGDFTKVICDLHGELAGARNCARDRKRLSAEGHLHLCVELIYGWATHEGIDLEAILRAKHEYNKTRSATRSRIATDGPATGQKQAGEASGICPRSREAGAAMRPTGA